MKVYQEIAIVINARKNCIRDNIIEWITKHEDRLHEIEKSYLPSGSGLDSGCTIDIEKSTDNKIILYTSFHHMNDVGMYDGWADHKVIITSSLMNDIDMRITGIDRNGIKEYLYQIFLNALMEEIKR